jgi:SAM-dependent methyltransferase
VAAGRQCPHQETADRTGGAGVERLERQRRDQPDRPVEVDQAADRAASPAAAGQDRLGLGQISCDVADPRGHQGLAMLHHGGVAVYVDDAGVRLEHTGRLVHRRRRRQARPKVEELVDALAGDACYRVSRVAAGREEHVPDTRVQPLQPEGQCAVGGEAGRAAEQVVERAGEVRCAYIEHAGSLPAGVPVAKVGSVDAQEKALRASSFGAVAAQYAEYRPGYPAEAVRWCVAPLGRDVAGLRLLDLGAGTGKLTELLIELGADVQAVEPDPEMLAELRRRLPLVHAMAGSAEQIPVPDQSVDAVLCGTALHWFDLPRALPEIARVLVPGGTLNGLWNGDDDRVEWVAGLHDVAGNPASPSLTLPGRKSAGFVSRQVDLGQASGQRLFLPSEQAEFPNSQRLTADSLVASLATHSAVLMMDPDDRAEMLAAIRDYLGSRPETAVGEFDMPMVTAVARVVRRG